MKFSKRLDSIQEYYFSRKLDEVRKLESQGKNIINLGIGSPDMPPSPETIDALKSSADDITHHSYQPYRSTKKLRTAISSWYKSTYNVSADPDKELLPLLGSKEGVFYLSMALLDEGDEVLIPDPGYPTYSSAANIAGATIRNYDLVESNNWLPGLNALGNQDLTKVKLMWINYPNMPTGAVATEEFYREIIAFGKKHDILICNDNPYSLVLNDTTGLRAFETRALSLLAFDDGKEVSVELNSLSKSFNMAGWRIGMMLSNETVVNAVLQVKSNVDSGMFRPLQDAAVVALQNSRQWHDERNHIYRERKELVCKMLDIMNFKYAGDQVGMFVWAKAPDSIKEIEKYLDNILYEAGVFITPGFIFGKNGERYIRISLCADKAKITEATKRIEKQLTIDN